MISVDTNILARVLLKDDVKQFRAAQVVLADNEHVMIPISVLLELAWVLRVRSATREEVLNALRGILLLPHVHPQNPDAVGRALAWIEGGMGVADAFHLALSNAASHFVTFDSGFAGTAARLGAMPPVITP